jgi:hypothetical protein
MHIEELIEQLEKVLEKHGNVKLMLEDMYSLKPVDGVQVTKDQYDPDIVSVVII